MELLLIDNFSGELAALTAAFLWATSATVYGFLGQKIPPLLLNLYKGIVALALIILTFTITSQTLPSLDTLPVAMLLLSGAIGIGLGDTAYFNALNKLGARRTLLLETLAPPMGAFLALIFLGEQLTAGAWCGILITILGVAWVITERTEATVVSSQHPWYGVFWGLLAAITQALGAVLSRFALVTANVSPLWSSFWRLLGGTAIVLLLISLSPRRPDKSLSITWSWRLIGVIILVAFGSTYLGIWLQQISLKLAPTGVAQTLLATSPLFVLPIAVVMGEKLSLRAILGALVALAGIAFLFMR